MDKIIPIEEFSKIFFGWQTKIEKEGEEKGTGSGGDFRRVFKETVKEIIGSPLFQNHSLIQKLEKEADDFLQDFREIEMQDLVYKDAEEGSRLLCKEADHIVIFTTGDKDYQPRKIQKSGIIDLFQSAIKNSGKNVSLEFLFSENKKSEIPKIIEKIPGKLLIAIYDDNPEKFKFAEKYIRELEEKIGIIFKKLYVWAKRGRIGQNTTKQKLEQIRKENPEFEIAQNLEEYVDLIVSRKSDNTIVIALLDFDGALADNIGLRERQASVAYKHFMKFLEVLR